MPDHVQLLITPAHEVSFEKVVQLIKGGFSFRAKKEPGSSWEVGETGYTEHRVEDSEDFQEHVAYIRQNPVRGRSAKSAVGYPNVQHPAIGKLTRYPVANANEILATFSPR